MLEILQNNLWATLNISVWLISVFYTSMMLFIAISLSRIANNSGITEISYLFIAIIILLTFGEWIDLFSVIGHKGIAHGFNNHLSEEGQGFAFMLYGIANGIIAYTDVFIIKKIIKRGKQ